MILVGLVIAPIKHVEPFNKHTKHIPTKQEIKDYARAKYAGDEIQFECLDTLWTMESHWNPQAKGYRTKQGQALGIPQALPPEKMAIMGADYKTNPYTQVDWGLKYIKSRYGNKACYALKWELNKGYY